MSATSPANAPPQSSIRRLKRAGRRSKYSSPTSNAFSVWDGSGYVVHAAFRMSSHSQPPPKTSGNWRKSSRWCRPQDEGRSRLPHPMKIKAIARSETTKTESSSTKSALFRPSRRKAETSAGSPKLTFIDALQCRVATPQKRHSRRRWYPAQPRSALAKTLCPSPSKETTQ